MSDPPSSMFQKADGMNYAPQGQVRPVCGPGEFRFAAVGLDHGHIHGMCNGLIEAGGELAWVYDPDPQKVAAFVQAHPGVKAARAEAEVLEDATLRLVAAAPVPSERAALGLRVMDHGKDYFADKPPVTTLAQLAGLQRKHGETKRIVAVYYAERLHSEAAVLAGRLVQEGAIGRVVQVVGLGPHRLNAASRPAWFWEPAHYGGILVDIGCHQIEQCLYYAGATHARLLHSAVANYACPEHAAFQDFGEAAFAADDGPTFYFRVDWFTPRGLGAWGDGRTFILGTDGYIELRKYLDIARDSQGDHLYLVDHQGEHHLAAQGQAGFPYFGQLVLDCLHRTEKAMSQRHTFLAMELALEAQARAVLLARPSRSPS